MRVRTTTTYRDRSGTLAEPRQLFNHLAGLSPEVQKAIMRDNGMKLLVHRGRSANRTTLDDGERSLLRGPDAAVVAQAREDGQPAQAELLRRPVGALRASPMRPF